MAILYDLYTYTHAAVFNDVVNTSSVIIIVTANE